MIKEPKMTNKEPFARVVALIGKDGHPVVRGEEADSMKDDTLEVVISVGDTNGVTLDMRFVLYEEGEELYDPSTGEPLGQFEIVKGRGRVVHVQDRMCRVRSSTTTRVLRNPIGTVGLIGYDRTGEDQYRTIAVPFKAIKIGDAVRPT